ncbi:MAG: aminotransferase class I/II-fold pyridoxal phosphate-dependent enzyme [Candidatus Thermoplasmatota archaeon]|nr:aminotransferase class I/II-fold pyridoxal phosphate-dependent enzyme [Candidatus Thermoplasmatota archaeon]
MTIDDWKVDTLAAHLARRGGPGPVVDPISVSTTYRLRDVKEGARYALEKAPIGLYGRWGTPTNRSVEEAVAALEGGTHALVTASGMGAISSAIMATVAQGDHIVAGKSLYSGTAEMMLHYLPRFGVETTFVDPTQPGAFREAVREETAVVYIETPANPTMSLTDMEEAAEAAHTVGALAVADNTFASPINQRPLDFGVDVVLHSATKYLGGHADVTGGAVVLANQGLFEKIWDVYKLLGPTLGAVDAFLIARGIKTLPLRVHRENATAQGLAEFLVDDPRVAAVHYPGLPTFPQYDLARRQMSGFGGVFSFDLAGGYGAAVRFAEGVKVASLAVSLGSVETLVEHPASITHGMLTPEERTAAGVEEGLIRVSVGLEDPEDLKEDFAQALA